MYAQISSTFPSFLGSSTASALEQEENGTGQEQTVCAVDGTGMVSVSRRHMTWGSGGLD